jgi:hypothetical protein
MNALAALLSTTLAVILTCWVALMACGRNRYRFSFVLSFFFLFFFLPLTLLYLLIADVEGHCYTYLHSLTHTGLGNKEKILVNIPL